jgi:hypothetical protein
LAGGGAPLRPFGDRALNGGTTLSCAPILMHHIGGRIGVSGRSSGRLIGGNYLPEFSYSLTFRTRRLSQLRLLLSLGQVPPILTSHQRSQETTFVRLSLSHRSVSRLPLLVNLLSVLCPLKHPPYPPTWPGCRTLVVPLSSTSRTSLEYCNLQHDSHPVDPAV